VSGEPCRARDRAIGKYRLSSEIDAVKQRLAQIPAPAGIHVECGGLYTEQQQTFRKLALLMAAGLFDVFAVLLWGVACFRAAGRVV
jgi:multidrug efflux pump subunit AcrB